MIGMDLENLEVIDSLFLAIGCFGESSSESLLPQIAIGLWMFPKFVIWVEKRGKSWMVADTLSAFALASFSIHANSCASFRVPLTSFIEA